MEVSPLCKDFKIIKNNDPNLPGSWMQKISSNEILSRIANETYVAPQPVPITVQPVLIPVQTPIIYNTTLVAFDPTPKFVIS